MAILTVFFSMTGQTWGDHGIVDLKKGYTNIAAEYIREAVGGDLFHIEQVRRYSEDHFAMIEEAKVEYREHQRPGIKAFCDLDGYDTVFLAFPNWWGTIPMPVATFLEHYDWSGKRIVPLVTSGGTGFGRSPEDIRESARGAEIDPNGLAIKGAQVEASRKEIQEWARARVRPQSSARPTRTCTAGWSRRTVRSWRASSTSGSSSCI